MGVTKATVNMMHQRREIRQDKQCCCMPGGAIAVLVIGIVLAVGVTILIVCLRNKKPDGGKDESAGTGGLGDLVPKEGDTRDTWGARMAGKLTGAMSGTGDIVPKDGESRQDFEKRMAETLVTNNPGLVYSLVNAQGRK